MLLAPDAGESAGDAAVQTPPAATPPIDLSARVKLGDREVTVTDLVREAGEANRLREFQQAVTGFHRAQGSGDVAALTKHSVTMLQGMGHTQEEANRLTQEFLQQNGLSGGTRGDDGGEGDDQLPAGVKELMGKVQELEERLARTDSLSQEAVARQMNDHLAGSVKSTLATDPELNKMVQALTRINGDASVPNLERLIREQTLRNLKDRREASRIPLQASWVSEEAAKAAKQVMGSISAVIGDVSRLGASAETDGDRDVIVNRAKQVQKPKAASSTSEASIDAWINAELTQASVAAAPRTQSAI